MIITKINLHYEGDFQFRVAHELSGTILMTDAPVDNHGKGRSFSPTDLVATALGSCMGTIMGIVAERHGINLTGMTISVEKEMTKSQPRRIETLKVDIQVPHAVSAENQKKMELAAATCPVHHSLHPDVRIVTKFVWGHAND